MIIIYIILGMTTGIIAASINCYKDAPWEDFSWGKLSRSIVMGGIAGLFLFLLYSNGVLVIQNLGLLILFMIPLERLMGELYKGFFKKQNHPEFVKLLKNLHIPLNMKSLAGVILIFVYLIGITLLYYLARIILDTSLPLLIQGMLVGALGTTAVAIGGGTKDSQFEGFHLKKFFRSPII